MEKSVPPLENKRNNNNALGNLSLHILEKPNISLHWVSPRFTSQEASRPHRSDKYLPLPGPGKVPHACLVNEISGQALEAAKPSAELTNGHVDSPHFGGMFEP